MSILPKVTLFCLLGAASLHQGDGMISWKPAWKGWSPFSGFRHPDALQGPSSLGLTIWNDFDADTMWPSFSHRVAKTHPSRAIQVADQGSWVKMEDRKDEVQSKFDCEEEQLQLKENQLRKERQNLKARRDDHKRQEQKRLQEQERLRGKRSLQQEQMKRERQLQQPNIQQRKIQELDQAKREAQFHQEKILQQQQREEKRRRVEEQNRIQRERQEQEARRQDELRLGEERKRLEKQRLVEKERQEQMRKEKELERRRVTEERAREVRQRQQEEAQHQRQMEEMRKQRERESTSKLPRSEIGKLSIPEGYNLEDISIKTVGNQAFVKGYHRCRCIEKCYEREFERRLSVPKNIDTRTVTASLYPDGQLKFRGVRFRQNIPQIDIDVVLEGVGLTPKMEHDSCSKFSKNKSGLKLKKMNARTGEIFEDVAPLEDTYPRYESEVEEDGLTIEVVE